MPKRPDPSEIQEMLCGFAEEIALETFSLRLDYSPESVRHVERMLGKIHKEYRRTRSEEGLHGIALEFGAYIVTVIQRHFGPAEWRRDCPSMGPDTFPLLWRGSTIFPYGWCMKRIFDGPADNVWSKFQVLVLDRERKAREEGS